MSLSVLPMYQLHEITECMVLQIVKLLTSAEWKRPSPLLEKAYPPSPVYEFSVVETGTFLSQPVIIQKFWFCETAWNAMQPCLKYQSSRTYGTWSFTKGAGMMRTLKLFTNTYPTSRA